MAIGDGLSYEDIRHRFRFHPADTDEKQQAHQEVRDILLQAALDITNIVPRGREKALAITKLEEAMMWANAGIARGI